MHVVNGCAKFPAHRFFLTLMNGEFENRSHLYRNSSWMTVMATLYTGMDWEACFAAHNYRK